MTTSGFAYVQATGPPLKVQEALQRVGEWARESGHVVQLVDPGSLHSLRHLESAVFHALRAFAEGTESSHTLGPEILLYASGQRRIDEALQRIGVRDGMERVGIIAVGPDPQAVAATAAHRLGWKKDPQLSWNPGAAARRLGLDEGASELDVLQLVALVDVRK